MGRGPLIITEEAMKKALQFAHDLANLELRDDYFEHNYGIKVENLTTEEAFQLFIDTNFRSLHR